MNIILGTTFLVAVLSIIIFGINNNVFAQGNNTGLVENDKIMSINSTLESMPINATLAFAQEGSISPEEVNNTMQIFNDTSMTMNATLPVSLTGNNTAKPMD